MATLGKSEVVGVIPPVPCPEPGAPLHLHCSADGKRIIYGCQNGVVMRCLPQQSDGEFPPISMLCGSEKPIRTACSSPDNSMIVGGDGDGTFHVWSLEKAGAVNLKSYNLDMQYVKLNDVSFSSDSRRVAICGSDKYNKKLATCIVASSGHDAGKIEGHTLGVNSITFRGQKPYRIASAGADGIFALHEGPPFKLLKSDSSKADGQWYCCRHSPDGSSLVACGQTGEIRFFHPTTGEPDRLVRLSSKALYSLAWSKQSDRLAVVGLDGFVRVFDVATDEVTDSFSFGDPSDPDLIPVGVCWGVNSWLSVLTADGSISGFAVDKEEKSGATTHKLLFQWKGPKGLPTVFERHSTTDEVVCGTTTGQLLVFMKENYPMGLQTVQLSGQSSPVKSIVLFPDGGFVVSTDSTIKQYLTPGPKAVSSSKTANPPVQPPLTAAQKRKAPPVKDVADEETAGRVVQQKSRFIQNFIKMLEEGSAVGGGGKSSKKMPPRMPIEIICCDNFEGTPVKAIPLANHTCAAVVSAEGKIIAYPWRTGRVAPFQPSWSIKIVGVSGVSAAGSSSDGTLIALAVVADESYVLNEPTCPNSVQTAWKGHQLAGHSFIEVYECIDATSSEGLKHIWTFDSHSTTEVTALAVSSDGSWLAVGGGDLTVYNLRNGESAISTEWNHHTGAILALDWSPDGTKLAAASLDKTIFICDIGTPTKHLRVTDQNTNGCPTLKFVDNNSLLAVGSDGTIKIIDISYCQ